MNTTEHHTTVRDSFDRQASLFTGDDAIFAGRAATTPWLAPLHPQMIVLDAACGAGHLAEEAAPEVRQVVGVDLTPSLLRLGAGRLRDRGVTNVLLQTADAADLPFVDGSFDLVVCRSALHHFPDPARTVAELARVCRPGGRLVVSDMVAPDAGCRTAFDALHRKLDPSHASALLASEIADIVGAAVGSRVTQDAKGPSTLPLEQILTGAADRAAVLRDLRTELGGGPATGFSPAMNGGQLHVSFVTTTVQAIR